MKHSFIMLDYSALAAVAAVIHEGTFERAATVLGMTPSAVSQRVRGLEERLGAVLIIRRQPCEPTDLGRKICAHFDRVRLLEHELDPALGRASAERSVLPTLRIAVNADSLATWFHSAIAEFSRGIDVSIDLKLDDEAHTADRLRSGEVLAAVSAIAAPVQGCKTIKLGRLRYAACASPHFMERYFGDGVNADRLARAPYLRFDRRDALQSRWAREAHQSDLGTLVHWVPSTHSFLDLTLAGMGWSLQPLSMADVHMDAGRLVELPPSRRVDVELYWTVARLHVDTLSQLTKAVRAAAARDLCG